MKRMLILLLALLLMAGVFSGCEEEKTAHIPTGDALEMEDEGDIVTEPAVVEPEKQMVSLAYYPNKTFNPIDSTDLTNRMLFSLMYQGLFRTDRNYNVEPVLCKSYAYSKDMMRYTFYLEEATFSDGTVVTAEDVVACLERARDSKYYSGRFFYFNSIEATEDGAVRITLHTPMENLPMLLDIPIIKQTELEEDRPLGTGPYALEMTIHGLQLRLRNDWWCEAKLPVDTEFISLVEAKSAASIRDDFQFRGLSLVCADPGTDAYADYRCDFELWDCEAGNFVYLTCNMDSELFSNDTVRASLTFAIDREKIAAEFYRGFGMPASLPASPQSPFYYEKLAARYDYEPEKFVRALEQNGFKNHSLILLVNKDDSLRLRVARSIANMLKECGLVVEIHALGTYEYQNALYYRTYDLLLGQTRLSANMDLTPFYYTWGNLSYGHIENMPLYALCKDALANSGNYYNLHQKAMEDGRLCPVVFYNYAVYATRGSLTSLEPARDNVFCYSLGKTMEDCLLDP